MFGVEGNGCYEIGLGLNLAAPGCSNCISFHSDLGFCINSFNVPRYMFAMAISVVKNI